MSSAQNVPRVDRTRAILEDLEAVRENLLAFSDDIWAGIDRQDLAAFDEGVRFMRSYVEKMTEFDRLAAELSVLIQQYTQVSLEATEETGQEDRERNERIITTKGATHVSLVPESGWPPFVLSYPPGLPFRP
jgi:hypothetical protein